MAATGSASYSKESPEGLMCCIGASDAIGKVFGCEVVVLIDKGLSEEEAKKLAL